MHFEFRFMKTKFLYSLAIFSYLIECWWKNCSLLWNFFYKWISYSTELFFIKHFSMIGSNKILSITNILTLRWFLNTKCIPLCEETIVKIKWWLSYCLGNIIEINFSIHCISIGKWYPRSHGCNSVLNQTLISKP